MFANIICLLNSQMPQMLSDVRVHASIEPILEPCKSSRNAMALSMPEVLDMLIFTVAGVGDHQQWDHHGERHRE